MKGTCSVPGCDKNINKEAHSFPKNEELKLKWLKAINRENWYPGRWNKVCSKHFLKKDFVQTSEFGNISCL